MGSTRAQWAATEAAVAAQRTTYNSTHSSELHSSSESESGGCSTRTPGRRSSKTFATFAKSPFKITPSTRVVRRGRRASSLVSFALGLPYLLSHS